MCCQNMILHLCFFDKFVAPFILFVESNFSDFGTRHVFYVSGIDSNSDLTDRPNVVIRKMGGAWRQYVWLVRQLYRAEKIIIHGLWDRRVIQLLALQPWLLKKSYWVIWGGDLYTYQQSKRTLQWWGKEIFRRLVIKNVGNLVTSIYGDYELARRWYGAKGRWHECFVYPSNLHRKYPLPSMGARSQINILLGNSATQTNGHAEVLEKLRNYANQDIRIFCPLSYGDNAYAEEVIKSGVEIFGEKFVALRRFVPIEDYMKLLADIDIAIFNHNRQQGIGNITMLLGMGKKVYMRPEITSWEGLRGLGLKIFDVNCVDISLINDADAAENRRIISDVFSADQLVERLSRLFN